MHQNTARAQLVACFRRLSNRHLRNLRYHLEKGTTVSGCAPNPREGGNGQFNYMDTKGGG